MKSPAMNTATKRKLEASGFRSTTVSEFLGLTPEDEAWIEMKRALRDKVVELRTARGLSETEMAKMLGSKQPRASQFEAGDASISYDLLIESLLALGATPAQIGAAIAAVGFNKQVGAR